MLRPALALLAMLAPSAWPGGCAAPPRGDGPAPAGAEGPPPAPGAGETTLEIAPGLAVMRGPDDAAPLGPLQARDLQPAIGRSIEWRVLVAGSDRERGRDTLRFTTSGSDRFGAECEIEEGPDQTLYFAGLTQDRPTMPASWSKRDRAISRFEPALVMGVPQLGRGESVEGSAEMRVLTQDEPPKDRDRGTAVRRLTYAADETIRTPQRTVRCQRVEVEFHAKLRFADATIRTVRWIEPGVGPVAEDRTERIVVMGLIPTERRRVLVRADLAIAERAP